MFKWLVIACLVLVLCTTRESFAQQLTVIDRAETYTDYLLDNPELQITPAYDLMIGTATGRPTYEILELDQVRIGAPFDANTALSLDIATGEGPMTETTNPGMYRGRRVASLLVHTGRILGDEALVVRRARIRVYDLPDIPLTRNRTSTQQADGPFASGEWYKIPVSRDGLYQLNRSYLESLGMDVSSLDPRRVQLWSTGGYELPEQNSAERPEFNQVPVLGQGTEDGRLDEGDRLVFFANGPHQTFRDPTTFAFGHRLHAWSDTTFVYLTIGDTNGDRLAPVNTGTPSVVNVRYFDDFIWKEEELTKTEAKQKSGRYWLGQTIPSTAQNQEISIFSDTLAGTLDAATPAEITSNIFLRAQQTTSFQLSLNERSYAQFSIFSIGTDYQSYTGTSARNRLLQDQQVSDLPDDGIFNITVRMGSTDNGANAFVDYITLKVRRTLTAENGRLDFFAPEDLGGPVGTTFEMDGFDETPVAMDITDPRQPRLLRVDEQGGSYQITHTAGPQTRILAQSQIPTPAAGRRMPSQNLRGISSYPDYIVVTSPFFLDYAQELADHRATTGFTPLVVTQEQIFNEFSSGSTDPTAIRDFLRHLWNKALAENAQLPELLLFFGDTTYDTKNILNGFTNHVITWQTEESINRISSYGSDDFFGLMDDDEGEVNSRARIDLGIGRIPAQTRNEAATALEKIRRYENPANFGDWQNLFTFVGDDDFPEPSINRDIHVENADGTLRRMNIDPFGGRSKKIYMFSYNEEITAAGRQVPGATDDLINTINDGTLVVNYSGHGNETTLSDEELYISEYVDLLTNRDELPVFVTATCQFGRYDDINAQSGAERLMFSADGGAIGSFTTTRVVFTSTNPNSYNFGLNIALSRAMLEREADGRPLTFGDIYRRTKRTAIGSTENSRKFILLGDPGLRFALPQFAARLETINGIDPAEADSVLRFRALDTITLTGTVADTAGISSAPFNGELTLAVFDAPRLVMIPEDRPWRNSSQCALNRGNENECGYEVENNVLFRGKVQVENGAFSSTFVIPRDISFSPDNGRVVLYAADPENGFTAGGSFTEIAFNGVNEDAVNDGNGPQMDVFINDDSFLNGSLVNDRPKLIVELADSSGINTTGTGVGHEITATIDTNPNQTFVLNDFYEGALNDYRRGRIEYPLDEIPDGNYRLRVRAWDVHNNPSEEEVFFEVANQQDLVISNVYNYPNPMNNRTSFTFEHNQQGNPLDVDIRIYTLSGKPVQHLQVNLPPTNTSSYASIPWDGRDRDHDRLGNGTYIYVLRVTADTPEGRSSTEKIEKLVIIR